MHRARDRFGAAACLTALALWGASASSQSKQPEFQSGVQVVEVDVRVFDRDGRFVGDLTRDDFELLEDGAPQRLHSLERMGDAPASDASVASGAARQTWIFLFDPNHLTPGAPFDRARKAVEDFVRDRFTDGDLGGIVSDDRLVDNRLTSVREELIAAVRSVKPPDRARSRHMDSAAASAGLVGDEADAERQATVAASSKVAADRAALNTLSVVNALGSGLARVPGPKTIVFLSDGFASAGMETTLRGVIGQVGRSGARVYAIDLRGVGRIDADAVPEADAVNSLAADTGGLAIRNENDVGRALDTIARDAGRYYVLAYQPANGVFDGAFRAIQVRVKRAGVRVRSRRGYLALEPSRMLVPRPVLSVDAKDAEPIVRESSPASAPVAERVIESPAESATGTVVAAPGAAAAGFIRLRPGASERILEIAGDEPASADALAHQGWNAYQRGDVETAAGLFAQAATKPDVRPWVLYTLGLSHAALGRAADAISSWERVRQVAPDFKPVYMDLADTYLQVSDLSKALAVLRDADTRWRTDAEIQNAVGVIHVRRGAFDDAIAAFTAAAGIAPSDALTYWNLGRAFELRYGRGLRYVSSRRAWVADDGDRQKAMVNYKRCVELGGPYAREAAEALSRLEWAKK